MTDFIADIVSESVDEAVRRLVNVEHFRAGSLVSMPVSYPSGATVVVEITAQKDRCFVSDRGGGHQEAEFFGASRYFATEARRLADLAGIRFDGRDMFVAEVPRERLRGAMVTVANCSAAATNAAALRLSERADRDARDDLYVRLSSLYKTRDVQKTLNSEELQRNGEYRLPYWAAIIAPHSLNLFLASILARLGPQRNLTISLQPNLRRIGLA